MPRDDAGKRGVACYRTIVGTAPGTAGLLRFGGCGFNTRVFVDGVRVGRRDLPYSGFTVEVPASANTDRFLDFCDEMGFLVGTTG